MECISIGTILIILIVFFVVWCYKRKSQEDEAIDTYISHNPDTDTITIQEHKRLFTLAEIKQAEDGKYSWDETGCVFEINSDGSVTIIGHFDPAELLVDPVQEMVDRLDNDGLIDMMPRMWSFQAANNRGGEDDTFVVAWNDEILSVPSCPHTIDEIKAISLILSSFEGGKSVITFILSKTAEGYLILMPCNEKEYILSLGAKACVERAFGNKIKVKISSPSVMGAFGIAIVGASDKLSKISFAFGEGEDYMCCNLLADDGVCEVKELLRSSIIQPTGIFTSIQHIAKGCMVQTLIREGRNKDYLLLDMFPYTMSLLLKENGRVIKIYDSISGPMLIPTRQGDKDISIGPSKTLSFIIGSNELIEDVMAECNAPYGEIGVFIEIDSDMGVSIKVIYNEVDFKINIGELIG